MGSQKNVILDSHRKYLQQQVFINLSLLTSSLRSPAIVKPRAAILRRLNTPLLSLKAQAYEPLYLVLAYIDKALSGSANLIELL